MHGSGNGVSKTFDWCNKENWNSLPIFANTEKWFKCIEISINELYFLLSSHQIRACILLTNVFILFNRIRSLHVKLAEKDAQIKILQCKYGESLDSSSPLSTPLRVPSFTSQSSISSYQDSGVMTASDGHYDEATYQNAKGKIYQLKFLSIGNCVHISIESKQLDL